MHPLTIKINRRSPEAHYTAPAVDFSGLFHPQPSRPSRQRFMRARTLALETSTPNLRGKTMSKLITEPKIYVACLAAYNNAKLHGVWIDATQDLDDIQDQVQTMLKDSPEPNAEEFAIHDYDGFGSYQVSEYEGLESVHQVACFIEEHDELGAELLDYYSDIEEAEKAIDDQYSGCYNSLTDYAEQLTEDTTEIPQHLQFYIDYERMGRDMELSGDIFTIETAHDEVHVFWAH